MMDLPGLEKLVIARLSSELDPRLTYHNIHHTLMVRDAVRTLAHAGPCTGHEKRLLEAAALLHDIGFLIERNEHERHSCTLARGILAGFEFQREDIERICTLIMATVSGHEPCDMMESIMRDADVLYLGGTEYDRISGLLYTELRNYGILGEDEEQWLELQIRFLQKHRFYTKYAILHCEDPMKKTLNLLLQKKYV